jgi:hypothetical protein
MELCFWGVGGCLAEEIWIGAKLQSWAPQGARHKFGKTESDSGAIVTWTEAERHGWAGLLPALLLSEGAEGGWEYVWSAGEAHLARASHRLPPRGGGGRRPILPTGNSPIPVSSTPALEPPPAPPSAPPRARPWSPIQFRTAS